ncbi:Protein of unknown function DUF58 [Clostridium cavendishii DSM 21758]|uniref:DUF58 domain-containing protein n=1 Tax=Clostridium cavendishii DSM 21758 TaxID=1121302 RepID=A0A1M6CZL6_9CLOT|nr:DUF58 domain-containing protein [Clostridium cavendishii]SHI66400.1 Protein of unknown function DUF58 [Clostridium cavendishii DSM 21758]
MFSFDSDFFNKLNNINLKVRLRLSNGAQGGRKSQAKGVSVEFSDFREYVPGDDFRRIDWNAYGRFDKLFVKLFMEEREAIFNIFLDTSKSMDYGEANKSHMALKIAASLSYVVLNNLDRVYVNILNTKIETTKAASGKLAFQRLLKELSQTEFNGATDLSSAILKKNIKGRGVSIVISDFFTQGSLEKIEEAVKYLSYKKQSIILVQILSKEEREPELYGVLNLIDSETNEGVKVSVTPKLLKNYEEALKKYTRDLEELAKKYGGSFVQVNSEDEIDKVILKNFTEKDLIY